MIKHLLINSLSVLYIVWYSSNNVSCQDKSSSGIQLAQQGWNRVCVCESESCVRNEFKNTYFTEFFVFVLLFFARTAISQFVLSINFTERSNVRWWTLPHPHQNQMFGTFTYWKSGNHKIQIKASLTLNISQIIFTGLYTKALLYNNAM
jgi:hypothetical protein